MKSQGPGRVSPPPASPSNDGKLEILEILFNDIQLLWEEADRAYLYLLREANLHQ